jgi:hypothetical protein
VSFADTITGAVERELQAAGHPAEVLNFGTHAYSIVNLSALLQAYVHQLQPQVVVVVVDIQVGLPHWPSIHPGATPEAGIEKVGWWDAVRKRGAQKSALLTLFDDPAPRRWARERPAAPAARAPGTGADASHLSATAVVDPPRRSRSAPTKRNARVSSARRSPRWPPSAPRDRSLSIS